MKLILVLCLAGLALANRGSPTRGEWRWESGKEYVYKYHGRLLTGIPQLADVYSGIGINATVHIQPTSGEDSTFLMAVKSPKFVRINDKLEPTSPEGVSNWRELRLPEVQEVPSEYLKYLTQPTKFTMTNGEITSAKFAKNEPVWSVNFKKALALQFQTKTSVNSWNNLENQIEERESEEDNSLTYWKVKEETIDGVCENIYEVRQLPKYMIVDRPEMVPYPEACPEDKYYGITKTKDVSKCEKSSSFKYFGIGHFGYQLSGNNMNMWGRSSTTRYIACGSRGRLTIQSIINDGELNMNLLGYKTERFVSGTVQVFHLKEVTQPSFHWESVGETVEVMSMMFEHTRESFQHPLKEGMLNLSPEEQVKASQEGRIPRSLISDPKVVRQALPRNYFYGISNPEDVPEDEIKSQITKYITEIIEKLSKGADAKHEHVTCMVNAAGRGFSMLKNQEEIKSVYHELKSKYSSHEQNLVTMKNVFFDTLLTSGTPEAISFIKDMIMSGELTKRQVASFFNWMPTYVRMPTKELLNSVYEMVSSEKIRQDRFYFNKAIMGFSTLLQKACISSYRTTMYPVSVFGEFCNPDSEIVVSKWIPYLTHELKYTHSAEEKNEIIVALGVMQHKSIVGELIPFVEGTVEGTTRLNRYLAIYSLASVADRKDPTHVVPIFFSVLSNPSESTTLRIASFNALMKLNPSMAVMHKIAALTWTTRDEELLKVINIAFFTLSKETELELYDETTLSLPKKAFLAYPLIKKTPGILPSSATVYMSDRLPELGVGFNKKTSWIASNSSFIPKDLFTEVTYFLDQYRFTPFSFGVRLAGAENLYHQVEKLIRPLEHQLNQDWESQPEREGINQEWEKMLEELKLKVRENGPMDGAVFLRWFESSPMFYNFDNLSREQLQGRIAALLSNPSMVSEKICGTFPLNSQQTLNRAPSVFMIPSDIGFPIVIENHMPVATSVRGELKVNCDSAIPSVTLDATIISDAQYTGWVGTVIPFTKEYVVTGVQEKFTLNVPVKVHAKVDIPSGKISFNFQLDTSSSKGSELNVAYFHVKPFITYKKITDLTPLFITQHMKLIKSRAEPTKVEYSLLETLGLDLGLKNRIVTESPYTDLKSYLTLFRMYNYNPLNVLRFCWTSSALSEYEKPSLRSHEHALVLDTSSSGLKDLQFEIKFGFGQKKSDEQGIKYHRVNIKNQFQNNQQYENENHQHQQKNSILAKLNPFQINTQDIENVEDQPLRKQQVKQALEKLNVESGYALSIIYSLAIRGSRPLTYTNTFTLAAGREAHSGTHGTVKSKWNFEWQDETSRSSESVQKICMKGSVDMPVLPMWNIEELRSSFVDFRYNNEIGFGSQSCSESSVKVAGSAKVSQEQKEYSRQSQQAKECDQLLEKRIPGGKLSDSCEQTRLQAQTVDEVEFRVEYKNVPEKFSKFENKAIEYLRMIMWPYLRTVKNAKEMTEQQLQRENYGSSVHISFHRETPSFDLTLTKPGVTVSFSKIRIPYPLNIVFPMKAGRNNAYLAVKAITGSSLTPECKVGIEKLTTFDNTSIPLEIDDCFHLISGDCSNDRSFGIFLRNMQSSQTRRELKVFLGKIALVFTPSEARQEPFSANIRVKVEQEEMTLPANSWKTIKVNSRTYGSIFRSSDNVFQLKSDQYNAHFLFDGSKVVVYASNLLKNKLCGLCGNFNQLSRDDLVGPAKCFHAKPKTFIASYRVQSSACQPLSEQVERDLQKEQEQCIRYKEIPTQITPALKAQSGNCMIKRHVVIQRPNEVCLSKIPVTECRTACIVPNGQMVNKKTPFVCIKQGRLADLYVRKASDGKEIPELKSMLTSFETSVQQPKKCVSSLLNQQRNE